MRVDERIISRIDELIELGEQAKGTRFNRSSGSVIWMGDDGVSYELSHQWGASSLNLLERVFGRDSPYYERFNELFPSFDDHSPVVKGLGILRAAKEDLEKGALYEVRRLVEAEVFDDFLEQAEALHDARYAGPAAVLAGAVLEDGLRKLCLRAGLSVPSRPKLDKMNADLAKKGVYSRLVQKRVTVLADVRNKAAHGRWTEFSGEDVADLIKKVRAFMEEHF